jgi:RNA polymerase sigma-70 factor (ECF subfamily)
MPPSQGDTVMPHELEPAGLAAARAGDRTAFDVLVAPHRHELLVHCYRLLGSLQDAEDVVQETFVRAWQRLASFAGRGSFRAWLYRIATNACLDLLDRPERRWSANGATHHPLAAFLSADGESIAFEPIPDALLADPAECPEARYTRQESVTLAFLTALRILPPRQRVVLLMRDVLGWSAGEVGEMLDLTVPAVHSALHRARVALERQRAAGRPAEWRPAADDEATRTLLTRYVDAFEAADVAALVALFKEDAAFAMPPDLLWLDGRDAIRTFLANGPFAGEAPDFPGPVRERWQVLPTRANGQPAFGIYQLDPAAGVRRFGAIIMLACEAGRIATATAVLRPELASRFGLPETLTGIETAEVATA